MYEIELKENKGLSFPVIRVFNIEEENKRTEEQQEKILKTQSKYGKRFIYIAPTDMQYVWDKGNTSSASEIVNFVSLLEPGSESVFQDNKKFIVRIKSTKTGKTIDLNVKCSLKHNNLT